MAKWWEKGVRFECQGSGKCCLSHGEYGHVYLTPEDRKRLAAYLKLSVREFTSKYCEKSEGHFQLVESSSRRECMFLENKRCSVYEARPTQCRTWPFWPEAMGAKTWANEVAAFCPGVGKGPLISPSMIKEILEEDRLATDSL